MIESEMMDDPIDQQICNLMRISNDLDRMKRGAERTGIIIIAVSDLISVVSRKERASPCRQIFEKSRLRSLASKVLIEALSQEDPCIHMLEVLISMRAVISYCPALGSSRRGDLTSDDGSYHLLGSFCISFLRDTAYEHAKFNSAYDVVVSAVLVLALVHQHLLVNKGGSRTYSYGSLDFRDTYISIILFRGGFVWNWFRGVALKKFYRRWKKGKDGRVILLDKYEARYKLSRKNVIAGEPWRPSNLALGAYNSQQDAETVHQIAAFYYDKGGGHLELRDGTDFPIPRMTERERGLVGKEKAKWVSAKAKEVFKDFTKAKAARCEVPEINVGEQAVAPDSWLLTQYVPCSPRMNPTPSTDEVSEVHLAVIEDSNTEGGSISFVEYCCQQVDWESLPPLPSEVGSGRESEDFAKLDFLTVELSCPEGMDALASVLDSNEANGPDLNSELESWIEELLVTQEEYLEREMNRQISEQVEPHRQLEEENFKLKRENERIPDLERENEQLNSTLLQVVQPLWTHLAGI